MPYFINTYRVPKPGQNLAVADRVGENIKASGKPGFVSIGISPPRPIAQGAAVVGTFAGFETLDDVDAFIDGVLARGRGNAAAETLNAMCDKVNTSVSRIVSPVWSPPANFVPKIVERTQLVAKPGKAPELLELLLEWREESDYLGNSIMSVALGGQGGAVRVTQIVESLQAVEDIRGQITASPRAQELLELINGPVTRGVGRITYMNQP